MLRGQFAVILMACSMTVMFGCNTVPVRNKPLASYDSDAGYRYGNIPRGERNSDSLTLILTFSGGGTRAAAFAYGVLEKLRDTEIVWEGQRRRLLDEVDVISSVSGGSLPAAYYGLFGERIFEDFSEKVLFRKIQGTLIKKFFTPGNWPELVSPLYGRTDMVADNFSRDIFDGKTYGDLLARNRRPFIVVNATDVSLGSRFEFTQPQFDLLYSDLAEYPVGNAVAASAAFPGLLTPLVLRNYKKKADYVPPAWIEEEMGKRDITRLRYRQAVEARSYIDPGRPFVHLSDGGVSDNLGLLPIIQLLAGSLPSDAALTSLDSGTVKKLVILTVNAKRVNKGDWDRQANVLNLFKVLGVAASVPLGNFTDAELALLRFMVQEKAEDKGMREKIASLYGEQALQRHFSELSAPDVDCHFIEVVFDQVADEAERDYLNAIPTAFELEIPQVDALRKAATEILDASPDFQALLRELH